MFEHDHRAGGPRIKPWDWEIYRNGQLQHVANMAGDVALREFPACLARETAAPSRPSDDVPFPSAERRLFRLATRTVPDQPGELTISTAIFAIPTKTGWIGRYAGGMSARRGPHRYPETLAHKVVEGACWFPALTSSLFVSLCRLLIEDRKTMPRAGGLPALRCPTV
jgi:hypothetical protein